ncbi:MAG: ABC transporter ATP-binding protein [Nitrospinota bacterium]|nr:MAG: ABC transporter ATP-binding protein [Nitrospinota bacterium]
MPQEAKLQLVKVSKTFGHPHGMVKALEGIDLIVYPQEFVSILGPSGCGKSTLFNIIAGLLRADQEGQIFLDHRRIDGEQGLVAYMPQKDLLFPWRTVLDNAIIGLELAGVRRQEARKEARELFQHFGLAGFEHQYPATLSGGMRQRVALIRTLLFKKEIMLLDEPFGALDAMTRTLMQQWLLQVWSEFRKTILFITHDVEEAIFLSDRIYVLTARPGSVKAVKPVPLPRPRCLQMVTSPPFTTLKAELLELVREESEKAFLANLIRSN